MKMFFAGCVGALLMYFIACLRAGLIWDSVTFALAIVLSLGCIEAIREEERNKEAENRE